MNQGATLGQFEHMVLLTIIRLDGKGHGMAVRRELEAVSGRSVTIGAVYATLDRLEAKGLLTSERRAPDAGAGGPVRRLFRAIPAGRQALTDSRALLDRLWEGVTLSPEKEG
ncbi:MAG: helix-turn-helix transcriptional regulator [Acidobacteria bacterium]|jgi:PadR family transcriptional regulator, regulatory protein PadR|nr:helix-turn-helix transcriptional regulator [Acidobacteriota bacterium]